MNKEITPKVSIVIPVYNGSDYLNNAIECALSQTYENIEVIVVNDGSNDDGATENIALAYGNRIRYYNKKNGGVSSALNLGIQEMSGEYFSWLSHDDAYTPSKVKDLIDVLIKTNSLDANTIAYSGGCYIDKDGNRIKPFSSGLREDFVYNGVQMVEHCLEYGTLNGCCMLIPKSAFERYGTFDETLRYSQDSLMWYTLFLNGVSLVYDNHPNVMYRLHPSQTSRTKHELFKKDASYIACKLAPSLLKISNKKQNYLYKYAYRMSKYQCDDVVDIMKNTATGECAFGIIQKLKLRINLFVSKYRDFAKRIYYRYVLRVKI